MFILAIIAAIVAVILLINGINEQEGRAGAIESDTANYWKRYVEQHGPDVGPVGGSGPRPPDQYNPEGFFIGAGLCGVIAVVCLVIGLN
jgi:hypothetical protein